MRRGPPRHILDVLDCPVQVLPGRTHGASRLRLCPKVPPGANDPSLAVKLELKIGSAVFARQSSGRDWCLHVGQVIVQ